MDFGYQNRDKMGPIVLVLPVLPVFVTLIQMTQFGRSCVKQSGLWNWFGIEPKGGPMSEEITIKPNQAIVI